MSAIPVPKSLLVRLMESHVSIMNRLMQDNRRMDHLKARLDAVREAILRMKKG